MKFHLALVLALISEVAMASCHAPKFTDPSQVNINSDSVLIVTHASATYDSRYSSKRGVDEATSYARSKGIPIIYLQDNTSEDEYYMADCNPDYRVYSESGELNFTVKASHVYVVGGHLEQCLYRTIEGVFNSWAQQQVRDLSMTFFMDGIYSTGELVEESDMYFKDFNQFTRVVTHRLTDAEPAPKITLLETLGVINQTDSEIDYLARTLPNYGAVFTPSYQVDLQLNSLPPKEIQTPADGNGPKILFNFVDSAQKLDTL